MFSIILPTYNEEEIIGETIREIKERFPKAEIVVVDDSPHDRVRKEVENFKDVVYVKNKERVGLSGSIMIGIEKARHNKIIVMDADLQHPLEKVNPILKLLEEKDLVLAERERLNLGFFRDLSSIIAISLANLVLFLKWRKTYRDPVTGFFGITKRSWRAIEKDRIVKKGWKIAFDLLKQIPPERVGEVMFRELNIREGGDSKFNIKAVYYFIISLFK